MELSDEEEEEDEEDYDDDDEDDEDGYDDNLGEFQLLRGSRLIRPPTGLQIKGVSVYVPGGVLVEPPAALAPLIILLMYGLHTAQNKCYGTASSHTRPHWQEGSPENFSEVFHIKDGEL